MRHPSLLADSVYTELISNIDLFPTLVEFAGGDPLSIIDGRSFSPILTNGKYIPCSKIYAE
jgi:arylsulfatase A-like enzyme